jgi:hypothetical protein
MSLRPCARFRATGCRRSFARSQPRRWWPRAGIARRAQSHRIFYSRRSIVERVSTPRRSSGLDRIGSNSFESTLLRAELLLLLDRTQEAALALDACVPPTDDERLRHGYHRAVLACDTGKDSDDAWMHIETPNRDYYAARIGVYRAVASPRSGRHRVARNAVESASSLGDQSRHADLLFTMFCGAIGLPPGASLDAPLLVGDRGDQPPAESCSRWPTSPRSTAWPHRGICLQRMRDFYSEVQDPRRFSAGLIAPRSISRAENSNPPARSERVDGRLSDQIHGRALSRRSRLDRRP